MSRFRPSDILLELIDLSGERMDELRQQLVYYRASVYKDETSSQINEKIDQLRLICGFLADDTIQESFKDYEAMAKGGPMHYVPGECSFSRRVTTLLANLGDALMKLGRQVASRDVAPTNESAEADDLAKSVREHRNALLALCRHGSRQWAFFQSL